MMLFLFMVLLFMLLSFAVGSIPVGPLIASVKGIDLRKVGSGNIGATNVLRAMGKTHAFLTLLGDILKGTIVVVVAKALFNNHAVEGIIGLSAILGHNFSVFLGFRGGKGVATSIGVLLAYAPKVAIITILLWLTVAFITRYSSMGAIVSFGLLPVNIYFFDYSKEKLIVSVIITVLLMFRHIDNISRLIKGTEQRIGERV